MTGYEQTGNELAKRVKALIPAHPEILEMESPWDLFSVDGFKCDDLQPSLAQAGWALARAKQMHNESIGIYNNGV